MACARHPQVITTSTWRWLDVRDRMHDKMHTSKVRCYSMLTIYIIAADFEIIPTSVQRDRGGGSRSDVRRAGDGSLGNTWTAPRWWRS